jgi:hypothetical protein
MLTEPTDADRKLLLHFCVAVQQMLFFYIKKPKQALDSRHAPA